VTALEAKTFQRKREKMQKQIDHQEDLARDVK